MMKGLQQAARDCVVEAAFHAYRTLASCRQGYFHRQLLPDTVLHAETDQPGACQDDRRVFAFIQLSQPRVHVAAQLAQLKVRAIGAQLALAPKTGTAYDG